MNSQTDAQRAVAEVEQALGPEPAGRRIIHCEDDEQWYPEMLRLVSTHRLHVLAPAADIVVFFDAQGNEIGWRDDGRLGAAQPSWIDRDLFLRIVVSELELPAATRVGKLMPEQLPPLGWTHAGVLFLKENPNEADVLRVWVDPENQRVIQCLAGPPSKEAESE
ncbi:MAG: hypothetical protein U1D55_04795 [Phycisphaerae bacterium]